MRTVTTLLSISVGVLSAAAFVAGALLVFTGPPAGVVGFYDGGLGAVLAMVAGFCFAAGAGRLWRQRR